ncbi:MAG: ATP-binding protein [Rhodobacteraceae bacterium]|nr:ATP-binding protein [Paracoccaceae bacterium]
MSDRPLIMQISLNALEHLGMNLYSNVPAVLSEIVANAWDADAKVVQVEINKINNSVTISDNGIGMTRDEVIDRFLTVGFKRRLVLSSKTKLGRLPMGRKGIGKLSSFSIARKIDVYTEKDGERTSFRMDRDKIKCKIEDGDNSPYEPEELSNWPVGLNGGTRIVLSDLTKNVTALTFDGLRKRIARRFAIIGPENQFEVIVNGGKITASDRGYNKLLEYVWTYGNQKTFIASCKNLGRPAEDRTVHAVTELNGEKLSLSGWIGTVAKPNQLKDEEGDNLNKIAVFMRGKLAQEDVLDDFGQKEIYADYIVGELHCDELDLDGSEDMATSSRQSLKQDDPRFMAFKSIAHSELRNIAKNWSNWRRSDGAKEAVKVPAVSDWLNALKGDTKKKAERWIGRLNTIRATDESDKKELLKASILAFESYRRKEELDRLDGITDLALENLLPIFETIDDLELSYYGQIVELRLGVIRKLQKLIGEDVKEKELQEYIFEHLWLIDPSWERARGTEHIETNVNKFLDENSEKLTDEERKGRIDIAYRTTSGKHIIIELKRGSVSTPVDKLAAQVRKYRTGVKKIIEQSEYKNWPIEIICLLGKPPPEWEAPDGPSDVAETLKTVDARIVFYNQLIDNAQQTYSDYLDEHVKVDKLWGIFKSIDDFSV